MLLGPRVRDAYGGLPVPRPGAGCVTDEERGLTSARSCRLCASCRTRSSSRVALESSPCSRLPSASFRDRAWCDNRVRGAEAPGTQRVPGTTSLLWEGRCPVSQRSASLPVLRQWPHRTASPLPTVHCPVPAPPRADQRLHSPPLS